MEAPTAPSTTRIDREGLKTLVIFVKPEVSRKIKIAAATHESTVQHIGHVAVMEWLERYEAGGNQVINTIKSADLRTKSSRTLADDRSAVSARKSAR